MPLSDEESSAFEEIEESLSEDPKFAKAMERKPARLARLIRMLRSIKGLLSTEGSRRREWQGIDSATADLDYVLNLLGPPPEASGSDATRPVPRHPVGVA